MRLPAGSPGGARLLDFGASLRSTGEPTKVWFDGIMLTPETVFRNGFDN
jgi:hypothetical protein